MEVWYHVVMLVEPRKAFGFAAIENIVSKAPNDYQWMVGETLKDVKPYFVNNKCLIAKVK